LMLMARHSIIELDRNRMNSDLNLTDLLGNELVLRLVRIFDELRKHRHGHLLIVDAQGLI